MLIRFINVVCKKIEVMKVISEKFVKDIYLGVYGFKRGFGEFVVEYIG